MDTVFFRRALAAMNRIYTMYLTDIWKYWANSQFQLNDPFSITEEQLRPRILSNLLCFCRTWVIARRYHSYSLCYLLDFRNVYIAAIHFFCGSVIIHRSFWSDPYVKDTVIFSQHFLQPSLQQAFCGWFEKIWRVCLFGKSHCSPALLKVPIYSTELVTIIFVWKVFF